MLNLKNTLDGYLKNVEVIGNTIQDTNNLADIRSVGDKVEGQELYEIPVLSRGKNLINKKTLKEMLYKYIQDEDGSKIKLNYVLMTSNRFEIPLSLIGNYTISYQCKETVGDKNPKLGFRYSDGSASYNTAFVATSNYSTYKHFSNGKDVVGLCITYNNTGGDFWVDLDSIQLEEGTQVTSYEPYQEQKLEILSPVQLEKVGDVADRIICKDGVWGVEKNVCKVYGNQLSVDSEYNQPLYSSFDLTCYKLKPGFFKLNTASNTPIICNLTLNMNLGDMNKNPQPACALYTDGNSAVRTLFLAVKVSELSEHSRDGVNEYLRNSGIYFLLPQSPQFIPLPHDQQVKLRTFAGQTNIFFNTEIPGQIKAQVPKSLGATVNTHTEQIADLHNSLERVKKLEETTVSTIETESNFNTVDATSNGYFEDVKLEGRTLVNLVNYSKTLEATRWNYFIKTSDLNCMLKHNTEYTIVAYVQGLSNNKVFALQSDNSYGLFNTKSIIIDGNGTWVSKVITKADFTGMTDVIFTSHDPSGNIGTYTLSLCLLEGDHTNNPPEFFEGLMSVGQDVEEVSVASVNENLFDRTNIRQGGFAWSSGVYYPNSTDRCCTKDYIKVGAGMTLYRNKKCAFILYDKYYNHLGNDFIGNKNASDYYNTPYVVEQGVAYIHIIFSPTVYGGNVNDIIFDDTMISTSPITEYTPHQSNKKPLLYYNPTTETWEKPILREWDTIEKHSDGKYYYHKRSGEVVLDNNSVWEDFDAHSFVNRQFFIDAIQSTQDIDRGHTICNKYNFGEVSLNGTNWKYYKTGTVVWSMFPKKSNQTLEQFKSELATNPIKVVYQLAKEEVYECTNIDLMTYSGETNYIINSGAISPKSLLKVHNNISNVVKILQEKVSLLENTFIAGLKSVLSGDMYSLATILYPEDFEQNDNTEQDIMVIPE